MQLKSATSSKLYYIAALLLVEDLVPLRLSFGELSYRPFVTQESDYSIAVFFVAQHVIIITTLKFYIIH
jgi:hypothetical protein